MKSALGEYIPFQHPVNPFGDPDEEPGAQPKKGQPDEKPATGQMPVRPLEKWLKNVEEQMQLALRTRIAQSCADYTEDDLESWLYTWP
jgi:hypothetical protein